MPAARAAASGSSSVINDHSVEGRPPRVAARIAAHARSRRLQVASKSARLRVATTPRIDLQGAWTVIVRKADHSLWVVPRTERPDERYCLDEGSLTSTSATPREEIP